MLRSQRARIRAGLVSTIAAALLLSCLDRLAGAQTITGLTTTNGALRAKAQADECFIGIGINIPFARPRADGTCAFGVPKVNQAYVWAMTRTAEKIWFGTTANPQCITQGGLASDPTQLHPYQTAAAVCEFGSSAYVALGILPLASIGDFRPPQMFVYDSALQTVRDITPPPAPNSPLPYDANVAQTRGIRAAATVGNLVMLVGPSLVGGLNFFFYDATTEAFLGFANLPGYDNIRQFATLDGQLYATVGQTFIPNIRPGGGAVLRWTGEMDAGCASCLSFETVGTLPDGIGAYITPHQGRLFVGTWSTGNPESVAGIFRSPIVPRRGLTASHAALWKKVWSATDYEPDRAIAASYATGALASFDGALYWGTMHVPWNATAVALFGYKYMPVTNEEWTDTVIGTFRTAAIFRGRNFSRHGRRHIDLLYGEPQLPVFQAATANEPARWVKVNNNMPPGHRAPLYGLSGFNNAYNNYTWSMAVWNNRLWVGTMDWSQPAEQGTEQIFESALQPIPINISLFFAAQTFGGDLFSFQDSRSPAVAESSAGVGNPTSYGIRNMVATAQSLFVGMANASNLLTSATGPKGGWELIELSPRVTKPINLLTQFSCRRLRTHDEDEDVDDQDPTDDDLGSGGTTCVVRTRRPAPAGGLTVGVLNLSADIAVEAPLTVFIPAGSSQARFRVEVTDIAERSRALLIAGLNGGTRVTTLAISAPDGDRDHDHGDCDRR